MILKFMNNFICISFSIQLIDYVTYFEHFSLIIYVISLMDKFIAQYLQPILGISLTTQQKDEKLTLFETDLKIFIASYVKNQVGNVNKQLAKKNRQLFILSSDNQTLKQTIQQTQNTLQSVKGQLSTLQQQKTKQKIIYERQISDINKNMQTLEKQMKKQMARLKMQKQVLEQNYKVKIKELKNQHQLQITKTVDEEKRIQQQQRQTMKNEFEQQKNGILKQNSQKTKQIIKKYQDKITKITGEYEDKLFLAKKQFDQYKKQNKQIKSNLQNKIAALQNNISRLKIQLSKEQQAHKKYSQLYGQAYKQLSQHQSNALKSKQKLQEQLHQLKKSLKQQQRKYLVDTRDLNNLLKKTIQQKDNKFTQTVEAMSSQFRINIQSLEMRLIEQKQMAITQIEVKRDQQNYDHQVKYNALKQQLQTLQKKYVSVSSDYEKKIQKMNEEHQDYIVSLNTRKQYELSVNGKNADREFNALRNKYELQIRAIHSQHAAFIQQLSKKHNEQKIALTNKLVTQYQSMISDQKASNQIQIKQKLIQFDRKAKGYEARLKDGQKKRNQIKVAAERAKMQMQMRVDSMVQLNQVYETEISTMNQKVQDAERDKERIVNQYQLKILIMKNDMKVTKQQYQQRQNQLRNLLESKLNTKNQQMNKILGRVKKQTQALIEAHEKRVKALEKQYNELKRVMGQKTSLPEDIQALKVFHGAYLDKQKEVALEKQKVQQLYRELRAKDAIDKVFAQKGSMKIHKIYNPTLPASTLLTFKSHQL